MRDNTKNKREYTKPVLERMDIDSEISLAMHSSTVPGPTTGFGTLSSGSKTIKLKTGSSASEVFGDSGVGSNTIDYSTDN